MRPVSYSMGMSADGYVVGPDGFDWAVPDDEVFQHHTDEIREVGVHLLGRKLHHTMLYWETAEEDPELDDANRTWARLWKALPKVVLSSTLTEVEGTNTRLSTVGLEAEIRQLHEEPGEGVIAIGGATLAAAAAGLGLIDEYRILIYPVLVGGGLPYFAHVLRRVELELLETRTFASQVVYLRYRVVRKAPTDTPFSTRASDLGAPDIDPVKALGIAAEMEDDEIARKMRAGK